MIKCRRATIEDLKFLVDGNRAIARETEGIELSEATLSDGVSALLEDDTKKECIGSQHVKTRSLVRSW